MKRLTFVEYMDLPHAERTILRRLAFGATPEQTFKVRKAKPEHLQIIEAIPYDLAALKQVMIEENERTGWFPRPWGLNRTEWGEPHVQDVVELMQRYEQGRATELPPIEIDDEAEEGLVEPFSEGVGQ